MKIGSPAMPAILDDRMCEERVSDKDFRLIAWVIYSIDGRELGLARLNMKVTGITNPLPYVTPQEEPLPAPRGLQGD